MCCTGAAWKREVVPDHKFDFIDTRDYHTKNFGVRAQYLWVYILVLKSFLVYISDIYTAVTMLSSEKWSSSIYEKCDAKECPVNVSFKIGKWIFVGCIIFSFLLLAYEARKAKKIIASRDISSAFTNVMANNYYSLRSYDHFCFFCQIENSTKKKDDFAFFIFFTFKEWKRLLLADGPRQCINAITLHSFWVANGKGNPFENLSKYYSGDDYLTAILLVAMVFTLVVFLGSLLLLIIAGVLYVPLLCYIRGNLKEYCCHKVDKRIAELIKKKTHQRVQIQARLAQKEARGDFSHLKNKKGEAVSALPQPTLPTLSVDDDDVFAPSQKQRHSQKYQLYDAPAVGGAPQYWAGDSKSTYDGQSDYAPSTYGGPPAIGADQHDYPPMPSYSNNGYQAHDSHNPQRQYQQYSQHPSQAPPQVPYNEYLAPEPAGSVYSYNMADDSQTHLPYTRSPQGSGGVETTTEGSYHGSGGNGQPYSQSRPGHPATQDYDENDLPVYSPVARVGPGGYDQPQSGYQQGRGQAAGNQNRPHYGGTGPSDASTGGYAI